MSTVARIALAAACCSGVPPSGNPASVASMSTAGREFHAACELFRCASFVRGAIRARRSTGPSSNVSTDVMVRASAMSTALDAPTGRVRGRSSMTIGCGAGGSAGTIRRTSGGSGGGGETW